MNSEPRTQAASGLVALPPRNSVLRAGHLSNLQEQERPRRRPRAEHVREANLRVPGSLTPQLTATVWWTQRESEAVLWKVKKVTVLGY